ncbi:hypothetical protein NX059_012461 [Plenodomus lindquistii]|nr:hypothetical protein NX059_012461 [Plenodomus lindquistii]
MRPNTSRLTNSLVPFSENGCNITSGVSVDNVEARAPWSVKARRTLVIYYNIKMSKDGKIEQISVDHTKTNRFSRSSRNSVRSNTSPVLREISPQIWNMLAEDPKKAFESFVDWLQMTSIQSCPSGTRVADYPDLATVCSAFAVQYKSLIKLVGLDKYTSALSVT